MKENVYSKKIADSISAFLEEDDWYFTFDEERGLFKFGSKLGGKIKKVDYFVDVRNGDYVVYAIPVIAADESDEKAMAELAEFICRANYGLVNGNFELDMRDGEIRYKSFMDCAGIIPTKEMVRNSIYCPVAMIRRYGGGFADIIYGGSSAKKAIEKCEGSGDDEPSVQNLDSDDDSDIEAMIERLAKKLGISVDDLMSDGEQQASESDGDVTDVKTDLFGSNGGNS